MKTFLNELVKYECDNLIYLNSFLKKSIATRLNSDKYEIEQCLAELAAEGSLKRIGRDTYQINEQRINIQRFPNKCSVIT